MKKLWIAGAALLLISGCQAQQKEPPAGEPAGQPQVSWDVKKEYDENGNLIRYDSVYTWSYTNLAGDTVQVPVDSVLRQFETYFHQRFPSLWERSFSRPLWSDSLLYRDFNRPDYFMERWRQDFFEMEQMFQRMDSLRNLFFREQYPGLLIPNPPKEEKNRKS